MTGRSERREAVRQARVDVRAPRASANELLPAPKSRFQLPPSHRGVLTRSERDVALAHVRALLEPPTAPYAEDAQVGVVRRFVAER